MIITARVSEDITGAIADSINFTIEELRVLVGRIPGFAGQAQPRRRDHEQTSAELLTAPLL
ncbi:MAG: hypothetical protein IPO00_16525 [Betaproteobacteria bacterium]|nr:hypothetical protein [Betaproteobacteria bacterium]